MVRLVMFDPFRPGDAPGDPLDKIIVIVTLILMWRLLGGC